MVYIREGSVQPRRSAGRWCSCDAVRDSFWGLVNFVGLFFSTIFSDINDSTSNSRVAQLGSQGAVKVTGRGKKLGGNDQQSRFRGSGGGGGSNVRGMGDVKPAGGGG
eukprot:gb/GECG01004164.1/.p1 GENE.gb/GECG01004164.1/~~gb/GECG01004164.1/.p1  ORF type:complete len:107 (+),score=6.23 gb/GECG01004164.1/:1-321(+)